jgi:thioredoxin 1
MLLVDLTNENFDEMTDRHAMALLDFWAPWCAPCKGFAPIFEAAALANPDILFGRINTEEQAVLAKQFDIQSIPTLLLAFDGTIVQVKVGATSADSLANMIKQLRKM